MPKYSWIRTVYLYLFALLGLVLMVIGTVRLINLGLKVYIFTEAEKEEYRYAFQTPVFPEEKGATSTREAVVSEPKISENFLKPRRQREAAGALSFLIVGLPLYLYHWMVIKKDRKQG
ncbi:MAG: hypothetical protein Q8R29_02690 [bacterium]|nr:hypothetical protein [bacterium]